METTMESENLEGNLSLLWDRSLIWSPNPYHATANVSINDFQTNITIYTKQWSRSDSKLLFTSSVTLTD